MRFLAQQIIHEYWHLIIDFLLLLRLIWIGKYKFCYYQSMNELLKYILRKLWNLILIPYEAF